MPKKKISEKSIKKSSKTKKDATDVIDELVDDIYEGEDNSNLIQKPIYKHGSRLFYVAVIVVIGFLAGVVGELVINNYFYHKGYEVTHIWEPTVQEDGDQQVIVFRKEEVAQNNADQIKTLIDNSSQAVVGIYEKRGGDEVIDQLYQPRDKIGNALVLTSDGWLVTTVTGMPEEEGKELVIIDNEKKVYKITQIILDETSRTVYLKVDAENLKVVKFADNSNIYPGLSVITLAESLISENAQSQVTAIEKVRYRPISGFADYFESSERYTTVLTTKDRVSQEFIGGAVIDMEGGIIGLYSGEYDISSIIPASHFMDNIDQVLRQQEIESPYFGVRFIDLSIAVGLSSQISEDLTAGALIFGDRDHKVLAVDSKSPAEDAGVKLGDIILKVNDDPVDARHSLTELIQQYKIGDVLNLVVQNSGEVREIEVPLVEISE